MTRQDKDIQELSGNSSEPERPGDAILSELLISSIACGAD